VEEAKKWGERNNTQITVVGLKTNADTRKKRMTQRGDEAAKIEERLKEDKIIFSESAFSLCNVVINGEMTAEEVFKRVHFIISSLLDI